MHINICMCVWVCFDIKLVWNNSLHKPRREHLSVVNLIFGACTNICSPHTHTLKSALPLPHPLSAQHTSCRSSAAQTLQTLPLTHTLAHADARHLMKNASKKKKKRKKKTKSVKHRFSIRLVGQEPDGGGGWRWLRRRGVTVNASHLAATAAVGVAASLAALPNRSRRFV